MTALFEFRTTDGAKTVTSATAVLEYVNVKTGARKTISAKVGPNGQVEAETSLDDPAAAYSLTRLRVFTPGNELICDQAVDLRAVGTQPAVVRTRATENPAELERGAIRGALLNRRTAQILLSGHFSKPVIQGLPNSGPVGYPALPVEVRTVILPPGMTIAGITVNEGAETARFAAEFPATNPPKVALRPSPTVRIANRRYYAPAPPRLHEATRPAPPRPRPPIYPPSLVQIAVNEEHAWGNHVILHINPIRYDESAKAFVQYSNLQFTIETAGSATSSPLTTTPGWAFLQHLHAGLQNPTVLSPGLFDDPAGLLPASESIPMVIITDDYTWNSAQPVPGMVAPISYSKGSAVPQDGNGTAATAGAAVISQFERLAVWKTSRGMRTRVMPISQIVASQLAGAFQSVNAGTPADLQEIIRDFIRFAADQWGTQYVLLGGGKDIVPMRWLSSHAGADFTRAAGNVAVTQMEGNLYIAKLSSTNIGFDSLFNEQGSIQGQGGDVPDNSWSLCCESTGLRLPFNELAIPVGPSWFFTTEADFKAGSTYSMQWKATDTTGTYIIVYGGPEVNDDFYWVSPNRAAPSDHYYSDVDQTSSTLPGFDANTNGILGQSTYPGGDTSLPEISLDGMHVVGRVCVGRAPITTVAEASAFVSKVIQYETFDQLDSNYVQRIRLASDDFVYPWLLIQVPDPAPVGGFYPNPGNFVVRQNPDGTWDLLVQLAPDSSGITLVQHLSGMAIDGQPDYQLTCVRQNGDVTVCAYTRGAVTNQPYTWAMCSGFYLPLTPGPGVTGQPFVRVYNVPNDISYLSWNQTQPDLFTSAKDALKKNMGVYFPFFRDVSATYRDAGDFIGEPIVPLSPESLSFFVNSGCHFLSLTSHGNVNNMFDGTLNSYSGAVQVTDMQKNVVPATAPASCFIAFATSCLTAAPDNGPSIGETWVKGANGALAYVGWTRSCWASTDITAYEDGFWCAAGFFARLGPGVTAHINRAGFQEFESLFPMILYGDPEMPIWTGIPQAYSVTLSGQDMGSSTSENITLAVQVSGPGGVLPGHTVTILRGWNSSLTDPDQYAVTTTDDTGTARFVVPRNPPNPPQVTVMPPVFPRQNFIPWSRDVNLQDL